MAALFGMGLLMLRCSCIRQIDRLSLPALKGLEQIRSFVIVYSKVPLFQLQPFDLVILEGDLYSREEIVSLRLQHKIVLAYLNIGEVETYRPYADQIPPKWLIGPNPDWPDHYFINPTEKGWRKLLKHEVIPPLLDKGVQGFLLDSVDLASSGRYPKFKRAMVQLIRWLHQCCPETYLILNNGQFLLDKVANQVHGLLIEEVFTVVDEDGQYHSRSVNEQFALLNRIRAIKERWNIPIFVVDYFPTNDSLNCKEIQQISRRYGFIYYLTTQHAERIYH